MVSTIRFITIIAAFGLVACGGGGGSKNSVDTTSSTQAVSSALASSAAPAPSSVPVSSTSSALSSLVSSTSVSNPVASSSVMSSSMASSSTPASMVSVKIDGTITVFNEAGTTMALDKELVSIELVLLDANEQPLATAAPLASTHTTSDELRFSADVSAQGATSLALNISAQGYTSYARKLAPESAMTVDAKLQQVPVQTVVAGTATTVSGATLSGFNIEVDGRDDQQRNNLLINIPQSLLPDDTNALEVSVRTFDPNDPNDAEFFPGAYADSDGNELASVGFNFAEIKTDTNEPLVQAMRKARQQKLAKAAGTQKLFAEEPVTINYQIPPSSCHLLESLGDSAPTMTGFQVPVYTYNGATGLWELIGQGTLYNAEGQQVPASQGVFDCASAVFTLEIVVTNEIFQREWWNLDYPLAFTQPTRYCAQVQLKNSEGQILPGITGYVGDRDGNFSFASTVMTTDENGRARLQVSQSSLNPDLDAEVLFFNDDEFGYVTKTISLSANCVDPLEQVIELSRPKQCEVTGKLIYENGAPVTRSLVYGFNDASAVEVFGFDFTTTNAQGEYRLNLPCGGEYNILNYASLVSESVDDLQKTRIDGNLDPDEQSDNGDQVVMKTQIVTQSAPLIMAAYDRETKQATITAYGTFDIFPLNANITITDAETGAILTTVTARIDLDDQADQGELAFYYFGTHTFTIDLPDGNLWRSNATITDALGKTWTDVRDYFGNEEF